MFSAIAIGRNFMYHYTEDHVFCNNENIAVDFHHAHNEKIHMHDFVELVYITGGRGYQYIDGRKYSVMRGDMLFLNLNHTHAFTTDKGMEYYNIYLRPAFISNELINADNAMQMLSLTAFEDFRETVGEENPVVRFTGGEIAEIESCLSAMWREYEHKENGSGTVLKSYLTILLTYLFRKMAVFSAQSEEKENRIGDLIRYIEDNCTQKLSLTELSEQCFYNPSYFCRVFKAYSGMTITEFIHESRVKRACDQLIHSHNSVDEICLNVGYTNKTLFYKKFREKTGMSPAEYRKKSKSNTEKV